MSFIIFFNPQYKIKRYTIKQSFYILYFFIYDNIKICK